MLAGDILSFGVGGFRFRKGFVSSNQSILQTGFLGRSSRWSQISRMTGNEESSGSRKTPFFLLWPSHRFLVSVCVGAWSQGEFTFPIFTISKGANYPWTQTSIPIPVFPPETQDRRSDETMSPWASLFQAVSGFSPTMNGCPATQTSLTFQFLYPTGSIGLLWDQKTYLIITLS